MKIVLTTGGTGGHIYPALALARAFKQSNENHEILFIGSLKHMEKDIINQSEFDFYGYSLNSGSKSFFHKIIQYVQLAFSLVLVYFKFLFKRPEVVIGFGAYITAPTLLAARFLNIPIFLHEQNSSLGKTNQMFFNSAQKVIVCYETLAKELNDDKVILLGNPRASEVANVQASRAVIENLDLDPKLKTVLIVMGSLGSQSVNDIMFDLMPRFEAEEFQVIYVTGNKHYDLYKSHNTAKNIVVLPYVDQPEIMVNADLVIARGGATTAAEICALKTASIIIPSPYVANNHQYVNAKVLADEDAAVIIKEADLSAEILLANIKEIIFDEKRLSTMQANAYKLAYPNASQDIIKVIMETLDAQ